MTQDWKKSLEEMISLCGYAFRSLSHHTPKTEGSTKVWIAKSGAKSGGFLVSGHTALEAVEKLYLKLKEKGYETNR